MGDGSLSEMDLVSAVSINLDLLSFGSSGLLLWETGYVGRCYVRESWDGCRKENLEMTSQNQMSVLE